MGAGSKGESETPAPKGFALSPALAGSLALVLAALGTIGLSGEGLLRAVRNHPAQMGWAVGLTLISTGLLTLPWGRKRSTAVQRALNVVLIGGVVWAIALGSVSLRAREVPSVTIQGAEDGKGKVTLTIEGKGQSLRTDEQLQVQVLGLKDPFKGVTSSLIGLCEQHHVAQYEPGIGWREPASYSSAFDKSATVLAWDRVGPDRTGLATSQLKIEYVADDYAAVCAFVDTPYRSGDVKEGGLDPRTSVSYYSTPRLPKELSPSPSPSPSPS